MAGCLAGEHWLGLRWAAFGPACEVLGCPGLPRAHTTPTPPTAALAPQAMDRAHRIGQQKPVLVFRLATAHSVEGKMLKRAASKMMLERLVIKKGAFKELVDVGGLPLHACMPLPACLPSMGPGRQGARPHVARQARAPAHARPPGPLPLPQGKKQDASMGAQDLLELLRDQSADDDVAQSGVVRGRRLSVPGPLRCAAACVALQLRLGSWPGAAHVPPAHAPPCPTVAMHHARPPRLSARHHTRAHTTPHPCALRPRPAGQRRVPGGAAGPQPPGGQRRHALLAGGPRLRGGDRHREQRPAVRRGVRRRGGVCRAGLGATESSGLLLGVG